MTPHLAIGKNAHIHLMPNCSKTSRCTLSLRVIAIVFKSLGEASMCCQKPVGCVMEILHSEHSLSGTI
uniref:Uncharacterized protein n=1 Tax=Anguilla anguilla TaxID=7936 RepID=A0A0E9UCX4_ANGAN